MNRTEIEIRTDQKWTKNGPKMDKSGPKMDQKWT